jgi:glycosyltransferase involved in cell wall biosynthesis
MRIATCTPVDFVANAHFFGRDSGLMCRGFQSAGHECQVIMPGTSAPDDAPDLRRARPGELESSEWWRDLTLDLVLLYAWGDPRYRSIAAAIRGAGILLVQNLDSAGIDSPYADFGRWWQSLSAMIAGPQPLAAKLRLMGRGIRDFLPAAYERKRLAMMAESDWIATVSPPAGESIRSYAQALGRPGVAAKVVTVPHPVSPKFTYTGDAKQKRVLCVGRWLPGDHHQKDPATLMRVVCGFLNAHEDWTFEIIGRGAGALAREMGEQPPAIRNRLILTEHLDRNELRDHYLTSRILLCPSRYESFHISSAEALCCGCSVVVAKHPLLASTGWFTTRQSGTLAASRSHSDLLSALRAEADAWESGQRSAIAISAAWSGELQAPSVASHLIQSIKQAS